MGDRWVMMVHGWWLINWVAGDCSWLLTSPPATWYNFWGSMNFGAWDPVIPYFVSRFGIEVVGIGWYTGITFRVLAGTSPMIRGEPELRSNFS